MCGQSNGSSTLFYGVLSDLFFGKNIYLFISEFGWQGSKEEWLEKEDSNVEDHL